MSILETPEERVRLLKAGIHGKDIEKIYVAYNGFKMVMGNVLVDSTENVTDN